MAKLRLVFQKEGRAMYISHLDLLRTFQRVFIREGLVLAHSQGFHPHPILSFALPLPVGQESDCEVLDFAVTEEMDGEALPRRLNAFMPQGISALSCHPPIHPVRDLARLRCRVQFVYDGGVPDHAVSRLTEFFARDSLFIEKRTKRKELAEVDIRPMIHALEIETSGNTLILSGEVAAQNPGLNPALLACAVERHLPQLKPDFVRVRRLSLLTESGEAFR